MLWEVGREREGEREVCTSDATPWGERKGGREGEGVERGGEERETYKDDSLEEEKGLGDDRVAIDLTQAKAHVKVSKSV